MFAEERHELGLGLLDGTSAEVISGEGGRDELGLHQELGRRRMLVDVLRLGRKQWLLGSKVKHASIS